MTNPLRRALMFTFVAAPWAAGAQPRGGLPSVAVLDFDFLEDHPRPDLDAVQAKRLRAAHAQLQQALRDEALYRVVEVDPSLPLLRRLRAQQAFMYRCADCAQQIGRALGTDLVMTTWVQKVSELILNLNLEVVDVASGRSVLSKSVDMRGNNDESWSRAVAYLVRDMVEKRRRDPRYGM